MKGRVRYGRDTTAAGSLGEVTVLLIPGFWLDASSWAPVVAALESNGHDAIAVTLPGMASKDEDRTAIGLRDHVEAVVRLIDQVDGPVVLVGHSAGGAVAYASVDERPDRVSRVIYVDALPLGPGECVNADLPEAAGEIPLPDWSLFDPPDLVDLDDEARARFRERAIPVPVGAARDLQVLHDARRHDVPATVICCEFTSHQLKEWVLQGEPGTAELAAIADVTYVDLATGHWPQFTRPDELAEIVVAVVAAVGVHEGPRD